jgi:hypothetical protein
MKAERLVKAIRATSARLYTLAERRHDYAIVEALDKLAEEIEEEMKKSPETSDEA